MSLIEDALRKAKKQEAPVPAEELPPSPDPQNLLGTSRPGSSTPSWLFWVSVVSLIGIISVALWLVFYLPSTPVPSASHGAHTKSAPPARPAAPEPAALSPGTSPASQSGAAPETSVAAAVEQESGAPRVAAPKAPEAPPEVVAASGVEPAGLAPQAEEAPVAESAPINPLEQARKGKVSKYTPARTSAPPAGSASGSAGPATLVESLLQRAYVYSQAGDTAQALECYDRILLLHRRHFEALLNRGILRTRTGAMEGAKEDLLAAQQTNPADPLVLNALGVWFLKTGDQDQAEETFRQAGDATALINLALAYWEKGEQEKVIATLEDAERADPQNPYAPYYLGLFYRGRGQHAPARDKLDQACAVARKRGLVDLAETIESLQTGR